MAAHLALSKHDEPKLFKLVQDNIAAISFAYHSLKPFEKTVLRSPSGKFELLTLSKDYTESPKDIAVNFGKVSLESITDEHPSLTQNISVEVHLTLVNKKYEIKNIFWVA